jgi:hypothetical protein
MNEQLMLHYLFATRGGTPPVKEQFRVIISLNLTSRLFSE